MKINVPENWSEITLSQFQNYHHEVSKDINDATKLIQTIATLCNFKFEDACKMKIKDVKKISNYLAELLEQVPETFVNKFEHKGKIYGFIPKLDEISIGEYADLEHYLQNPKQIWNNMHWVMSILYREVEIDNNEIYTKKIMSPAKKEQMILKNFL